MGLSHLSSETVSNIDVKRHAPRKALAFRLSTGDIYLPSCYSAIVKWLITLCINFEIWNWFECHLAMWSNNNQKCTYTRVVRLSPTPPPPSPSTRVSGTRTGYLCCWCFPQMTHERLTCVRLSLMKLNSEVKHHNSSYIFNFLMSHTFTFVYVVFCGICSTDLAGGISGCGKMIEQERLSLHVYHRKSCSMMYMYITYYCVCVWCVCVIGGAAVSRWMGNLFDVLLH